MNRLTRITVLILAVVVLGTFAFLTGCEKKETPEIPQGYQGVKITSHQGAYPWQSPVKYTYNFDFSVDRKSYYTTHQALKVSGEEAFNVESGKLKAEGGNFTISTTVGLGDDYGLEKGHASFKLYLQSGKVHVGLRTSQTAVTQNERGLWITFDGSGNILVKETECGLEATLPAEADYSKEVEVKIYENVDSIAIEVNGKMVGSVDYVRNSQLIIRSATGEVLAQTDKSKLYTSGYFQICCEGFAGTLDDIEFTNVVLDNNLYTDGKEREIDYSTWVATDDLDRTTALNAQAGDERDEKYVGVFYFLCWTGAGQIVQDNTKLYLNQGFKGLIEHFDQRKGGEAYWAEPYFGYYINTDTWVYRKHGYMLEAAGVDFIYLDVSNAEVFVNGHMALFDTWLKMRQEGTMTPQIVFLTGDNPSTFEKDMETLFKTVYSDDNWDTYSQLFFNVDGKPLIFGNISGVSDTMKDRINEKFTVRGNWAWQDKDGYWNWLQEYTYDEKTGEYSMIHGGWGRDQMGNPEALAISLGHHPSSSKGRSYVYGQQPSNGKNDFEFSSVERAGKGLNFESQFKAAMSLDPTYLLITGWNEWIAGCSYTENGEKTQGFCGGTSNFYYVDQFNVEFSRDGEPMRNVDGYGIGDNYYYQMIDYIRRFKGISKTPVADSQQTIDIYDKNEWNNITLEYRDNIGDTELRNTVCYDDSYRYINNTGRNDLEYAKVSQDSKYLYFMVKCVNDIIIDNSSNWMNLYINTDGNNTNGWNGFDYVLNRKRDSFAVSIEKFKKDSFNGTITGAALFAIDGKYMTISVSKEALGLKGTVEKLLFKWADNSTISGDIMEFMDTGDTAPDDRYAFVYLADSCSDAVFDKSKTPVVEEPQIQRPEPDLSEEGELSIRKVEVLMDFESERAGSLADGSEINDLFEIAGGTSTSNVMYESADGNTYVNHTGFMDLRTWYDIQGPYVFSADIQIVDIGNSALYIRGEMPGLFAPYNPAHSALAGQEVNQVFNYFEVDWYTENGGRDGNTTVAGSGLGLYFTRKNVSLYIKRYVEDGLTVVSKVVNVKYPESVDVGKGFFNVRVEDDCNEIRIYVENILIAKVVLENPGVVYESDGTGNQYYGKATVYDPDGNVKAEVENTRLNSRGSQIAFTTRSQTIRYDNIYLSYEEEVMVGNVKKELLTGLESNEAAGEDDVLQYYGMKNTGALLWIILGAVAVAAIAFGGILVLKKRIDKGK